MLLNKIMVFDIVRSNALTIKCQTWRLKPFGFYGDMNYYGDLLKVERSRIYYNYGCSLNNMTGVLMIEPDESAWTNIRFPDGILIETRMFRSLTRF